MKNPFWRILAIFLIASITFSVVIAVGAASVQSMTLADYLSEAHKVHNIVWPFLEEKIFPLKAQYSMEDVIADKYPQLQQLYDAWWDAEDAGNYDEA